MVLSAYGAEEVKQKGNEVLIFVREKNSAAQLLAEMAYVYSIKITDECNIAPGQDPFGPQILDQETYQPYNGKNCCNVRTIVEKTKAI